ncbi:tape measure protein [Corynebacterium stationis]|uniref:tape measure protein n=1 Tax=Corynebacterium stationis TaxID=1705 RepID=UPI0028AA913E|nr:tape measure protein [Corynebacterium stationis]
MAELGVGWIAIRPDVSKITPEIKKALGASESEAGKSGNAMGKTMGDRLGGALKKSVVGTGVAAGGLLAASLTKGIGRLSAIESAEAKLTGLGNSAADVSSIMENANTAVKGTAYGLDEAATTAAMAVAAGIKPGQELEGVLTTVADTASIAGASMSEMGNIFGSVAARGKLQGDDLMQLQSRGIPVLQLLAEELGKTSEEVSEMVSKGEIDFKIFESAMATGVGGAAQSAGETTIGAFKNMGAAAGRLGATLAGPFYDQASGAFSGVTDALDAMNGRMKPVMADFGSWLTGTAIPQFQEFSKSAGDAIGNAFASNEVQSRITRTITAFQGVIDAGKGIAPVALDIAGALGKASSALGVATWDLFVASLTGVGAAAKVVTPPLEAISKFMQDHPALVTAAVGAWTAFKTVPGILDKVKPPVEKLVDGMKSGASGALDLARGVGDMKRYFKETGGEISTFDAAMRIVGTSTNTTLQKIGSSYINASLPLKEYSQNQRELGRVAKQAALDAGNGWDWAGGVFTSIGRSSTAAVTSMAGTVKGVGAAAFTGLKQAGKGAIDFFGGPWAVGIMAAGSIITGLVGASNNSKAAQENMAKAALEAAEAQDTLRTAVSGTTGALEGDGLTAATKLVSAELTQMTEMAKVSAPILGGLVRAIEAPDLSFWQQGFWSKSFREFRAEVNLAEDAQKGLEKAALDLNIPMSEVNRIVAEGGSDYKNLVANLRETGGASGYAADELESARSKIEQTVQAGRDLSPAFVEASQAVDVLADSASSADDKLSALQSMMQLLGLAPKDAERAMRDASEAVDELVEAATGAEYPVETLGDALVGLDGKIDTSSQAGRDLYDALTGLGDELTNVAVNGGDVQGAFDEMAPAIEALARQFNLTEDEVRALGESYGLVPDEIETLVNLEGATDAEQDLINLASTIAATPDEKQVKVAVEDEESIAKIESFGFKVKDLKNGNVRVDVDDEEAKEKLNWLILNEFPKIDLADPTAKVNLNTDELMYNLEYAQYQLDTLDLARPMPWASMDISALTSQQLTALQQVGLLDGQTPTPAAGMNIADLTTKQQLALAQVFNLDGQTPTPAADMTTEQLHAKKNAAKGATDDLDKQRPTPRADLNTKGVQDGVAESKSWLAQLPATKAISVVFSAIYKGFRSGFGGAGGSEEFAAGGKLKAYATGMRHSGYRLPKTGPGTETVDGFTAFDQNMVPAARLDAGEWVINGRSSEKYDKELREINRGTFPKLPGYADGGRAHADEIDDFVKGKPARGHRAVRPLEGAPYDWGGINWGDCSGAMSAIARFAVGIAPFAARFATGNQREALSALGFTMGRGPAGSLRIGWMNGGPWGGHTSGTLPNGVNVEMGGGRGNGQYGGSAAAWNDPSFTDHAYLNVPTSYKVDKIEGAEGLGAPGDKTYGAANSGDYDTSAPVSTRSTSTASAGSAIDKGPTSWSEVAGVAASEFASGQVKDALGIFGIPDSPPALQAYREWEQTQEEMRAKANEPAEVAKTPSEAGQTRASQAPPNLDMPTSINKTVEIAYDPAGGAKQWATVVEMALSKLGLPLAHKDRTIDQIDIESGGDPNAKNDWDINAQNGDPSIGLLQVIKSTFEANRAQDLPNDQRHPLANIYAGINYANKRYGSLDAIWPTRNGYNAGGWVRGIGNAMSDIIPAALSNGEFVVRGSRAAMFGPVLEQINGDAPIKSSADVGSKKIEYHFHGADSRDLIRQLEARELAASMQHLGG